MPGSKPAIRPRPMGGFNTGFGHFNEHLDEDAVQQAMQQKALGQQAGAAQTSPAGTAHSGPLGGGAQPAQPREVGTLQEELITRPAKDVVKGLLSLFDLKSALGIDPQTDDPQTQAKKQQMLQRFSQLTEEQQGVAQQEYQRRMQEKQHEEEEKAARKQQEEQAKAQTFEMPSGPQKGPVGPSGSKKQQAAQRIQQDRKTLSNAKGAN